jgi:hypothetical protein
MDFIIRLLLSTEGFNIIFIVVNRLFKERYYIFCTAKDERTSTEEIIYLFLRYVYRIHSLLDSIILDKGRLRKESGRVGPNKVRVLGEPEPVRPG